MSDSDFEIDFITRAASTTQKNIKLALAKAEMDILLETGIEEEMNRSKSGKVLSWQSFL